MSDCTSQLSIKCLTIPDVSLKSIPSPTPVKEPWNDIPFSPIEGSFNNLTIDELIINFQLSSTLNPRPSLFGVQLKPRIGGIRGEKFQFELMEESISESKQRQADQSAETVTSDFTEMISSNSEAGFSTLKQHDPNANITESEREKILGLAANPNYGSTVDPLLPGLENLGPSQDGMPPESISNHESSKSCLSDVSPLEKPIDPEPYIYGNVPLNRQKASSSHLTSMGFDSDSLLKGLCCIGPSEGGIIPNLNDESSSISPVSPPQQFTTLPSLVRDAADRYTIDPNLSSYDTTMQADDGRELMEKHNWDLYEKLKRLNQRQRDQN
uniref:Uncharacterized protein n=1 Tax=Panagrolaimus sp. ES5 TaxID=591445 RepID=A0AC34FGC9_9BILA